MDTQTAPRQPRAVALTGLVGVLAVSIVTGHGVKILAPLVLVLVFFVAFQHVLFRWESLLGALVLVVMFIPIKRYEIAANLPFNLEPYRIAVGLILVAWGSSLLIDPRVRLQRTYLDAPLALILGAVLASDIANPGLTESLGSYVAKDLTFFLSFLLLYYFIASVVSRDAIDLVLRVLVIGGAVVAAASIVEQRTGYNVFFHVADALPFLEFTGAEFTTRGGRLRVFGSAQHPIALGAMLAVLIPIAISMAHRLNRRWWIPTTLLFLGVLATASRTPIVMLVVTTLMLLKRKPATVKRLAPLAVPGIVIVHLALPGAIGTLRDAFFPPGGIVAEQTQLAANANPELAGGRLRLIGPSLSEWSQHPVVGRGYGTRITGFSDPRRNSPILDNQWLASLLEIGIIGVLGWLWVLIRSVRRLLRVASEARDPDDWLYIGFAASLASFAVGLLTYDGFSFIQVAFVFWILLALSAVAVRTESRDATPELRPSEGLSNPPR
jgi:hypothetical protein